jgi:16S rRNA (cytosine967-C5)-methyltransferase
VEARDLTEYKVGLIEENIERCRVENMSVKVWDATQPDTTAADTADLVIADLPCSGLGILHKKPDIKYQMTPAQAGELAALQRRILAQVQHFVKPGGRLLYSTCTVNPAENEENADWFADSFPDFTKRSGQQILPDEIRDGFYIAVFDRRT